MVRAYQRIVTRFPALQVDLLAGLTAALVGIPQGIAYAMMSGLPPAYGLTTMIVPGFVAALVGRQALVLTGPTNGTTLLIFATLAPYLGVNGLLKESALPLLATLTLMTGLVRLGLAWAGGARIVRFLPESVLVGFTAGAGVLIATMQLDEALGLPPVEAAGLFAELRGVAGAVLGGQAPSLAAVGVCVGTVGLIAVGRRCLRLWPMALIAVVLSTALAMVFDLDSQSGLALVLERAGVTAGWPRSVWPSLDPSLASSLFVPSVAIVLLGTLELTATLHRTGGWPDMKREIIAQGLANVAGAFSASFPASASLTRSALLRLANARTRLAAVVTALAVVPALLFGGATLGHIPQAALAGVLVATAYQMIDRQEILRMWHASPETRWILALTVGATLALPLPWAILLGAGLGLVIHLANTSIPRLRLLAPIDGRLVPVQGGEVPPVVVVEVSGDLHYAAVPSFAYEANRLLPAKPLTVVLDLSHAHALRFAAMKAMEGLARRLEAEGGGLHLAGVSPAFVELLRKTGCMLPVTPASDEAGASVRACLSGLAQTTRQA